MKKLLALILALGLVIPMSVGAATFPLGRAKSGDLTVSTSRTEDSVKSNITVLSSSGIGSTTVSSVSGFAAGDYVLLAQMTGTGAGNYEYQKIRAITGNSLFFYGTLANTYQATAAQVVKINEYHDVTVTASGSWTASSWNGTTGGILAAFITGTFTQSAASASTTVAGRGGDGGAGASNPPGGTPASGTGTGGGEGSGNGASGSGSCGGGGASHGGTGSNGGQFALCTGPVGAGNGSTYGSAALSTAMHMGSGGGGGYAINGTGNNGGPGGGILFFTAQNFAISGGLFTAQGSAGDGDNNGGTTNGGGGGGSGGSIRLLPVKTAALGTSVVTAAAGSGGPGEAAGGSGGTGRVATISAATVTGTASPTIDTSSTDRVYPLDIDATNVMLGTAF